MSDIVPVTKSDLLKTVGQALTAQQKLREVMQGVAAQTAGSKQLSKTQQPKQ